MKSFRCDNSDKRSIIEVSPHRQSRLQSTAEMTSAPNSLLRRVSNRNLASRKSVSISYLFVCLFVDI